MPANFIQNQRHTLAEKDLVQIIEMDA